MRSQSSWGYWTQRRGEALSMGLKLGSVLLVKLLFSGEIYPPPPSFFLLIWDIFHGYRPSATKQIEANWGFFPAPNSALTLQSRGRQQWAISCRTSWLCTHFWLFLVLFVQLQTGWLVRFVPQISVRLLTGTSVQCCPLLWRHFCSSALPISWSKKTLSIVSCGALSFCFCVLEEMLCWPHLGAVCWLMWWCFLSVVLLMHVLLVSFGLRCFQRSLGCSLAHPTQDPPCTLYVVHEILLHTCNSSYTCGVFIQFGFRVVYSGTHIPVCLMPMPCLQILELLRTYLRHKGVDWIVNLMENWCAGESRAGSRIQRGLTVGALTQQPCRFFLSMLSAKKMGVKEVS